jgi:hypothetical protein
MQGTSFMALWLSATHKFKLKGSPKITIFKLEYPLTIRKKLKFAKLLVRRMCVQRTLFCKNAVANVLEEPSSRPRAKIFPQSWHHKKLPFS